MTRHSYDVTYRVGSTNKSTIMSLYGGTESEAKEVLYSRGSVARGQEIIILRIKAL